MEKKNCENEERAFLASGIKEGRTSRKRRLQLPSVLNNRSRFLNLACLILSLVPKGTSQFLVPISSSFLSSVSSRFIYFVIFSQKHDSQYATELAAFQLATISSFSNTERRMQKWFIHIRQVYFVLSMIGTHIVPLFPLFCSERSKQGVCA